ncbi:PREDICTED: eIF-2-alpha kinase activator GCN1-like isoform X1 [Camelina sativa]|uniref:EIF-2-alpha kinase activator GCN1-like isoform X1 n=1 Tax=Camelina sativa TaxID=90675 RepID=A0ABM0WFF2_CAMSA|nr:PREDICTED: eIF-2-alpha kinase activator GCN1-like isoform X1 [Camelina sativa]
MASPSESLLAISGSVSTSSTLIRLRIFRHDIPEILQNSDMTSEIAPVLVDIIFQTLAIYDDRSSRKAVDDLIVKGLGNVTFMKTFAAMLVQVMDKQLKCCFDSVSYRLLTWSCLLLENSQFATVSKNAFARVASTQASILRTIMESSFRMQRACKRFMFHLFSQSQAIYNLYMDEVKGSRIPCKDAPELLGLLLEFSCSSPALFEQSKAIFIDIYVKDVLNAREKQKQNLSKCFQPLLQRLSHEEFQTVILPAAVKMLKRNPEIVLESVGFLLANVNIDLSKYALEVLPVILPQARHVDEDRRLGALSMVRCLSEKSSNPDTIEAMFASVKAIIGGSEGRLQSPHQRIGMLNAVQELASAPEGKYIGCLSTTVCSFLIACYKDEGNEDVKLSILSAVASWASRSSDAIQPNLVSFIATGLKEKETLRRGHLRCLRIICRNPDTISQISALLSPLIQLVKTGFTKAVQRLDGIYALLTVSKIAACDIKAEDTVVKEKLWTLISLNEPSLVQISLASKLSSEDCVVCVELLEVLLVEHSSRVLEAFSLKSLSKLLLFLLCHPSWNVRKTAYSSVTKIFLASSQLATTLLDEFSDFLSITGDQIVSPRTSDAENPVDHQAPFVPSVEVLVKALIVISSAAVTGPPSSWIVRSIFCSHHPSIVGTAKRDAVWKRLQKCLKTCGFDVATFLSTNGRSVCKSLLGPMGLMSSKIPEQEAAVSSLSTLMSLAPEDTFTVFKMHLQELPDRLSHDMLSVTDINIFHTPEGMLLSEQGIYVAETIGAKYTRQEPSSNHSLKKGLASREAANSGRRDTSKLTKKADKGKTAKEEARELMLKEEASTRENVHRIQKSLSLVLHALGEMGLANPVFCHSQLPFLATFLDPLLRSPIVSATAFENLVKLARCTVQPLCNWALEISTALRLIAIDEVDTSSDFRPSVDKAGKTDEGLFERIINGLSISCKSGPLPVDTFTFIFPILERILLSSKRTKLHDDVLHILCMHLDPMLPLPRLRMISVLYHLLGVVPAYQASVGPALNELCLGLQADDVANALYGVYSKDVHVRMACLNAVKCIPAVSKCSLPQNVDIATNIWIALHDPEKSVAEAADDIWSRYGYDLGIDYSGIFKALSHTNLNVRLAAAEALADALHESPASIQLSLSTLFSLYIRDATSGEDVFDAGWIGRQGIALALQSAADVLTTKDLPAVMTFLISRALADPNTDVRGRMINAGIMIIDKHGKENVSLLFPIFENYLNKEASDEKEYDLVREGVVIFTGALAKHLAKDDPKVHTVVEKLLEVLNTPSECVQRAVSTCLSPLVLSKQEDAPALFSRLLDKLMKSDKYGERRGAAFGLAGVIMGFGISSLKKYGLIVTLQEALIDRNSAKRREGALLAFECLCEKLGKLFEPYVIKMLPLLLVLFSDQVGAVREAAECAARAMMSQLSAYGVKLVLPSLLKGLEDKAWRTKQSSVQLLGAMAFCAPQQLSQCLPRVVPKLTEVLTDTHPKVQSAGQLALQQVGSVIKNPEISSLVPTLLLALTDPNEYTRHSLDILLQTTFVNSVDAPSLALLVPIVHRGLRERSSETKKKASQIVGNMCSLVTEPKDMIPYIGLLLPEVKKVLVDPIPEVRSVAARAVGSLIRGMGEDNFPDLVPWLFETLKSDASNVERSGAAQGLSEVLAALGTDYFENLLPDLIRHCSHQKASVRDGYLTLFKFLPRSLGTQFQKYLQLVLPAILDGLADENESVRDAALGAGHVLVEHHATTSLPLLLPAVEDGIFNDNWRIRQSSVELLGDLLFKVAGTSGKALLEGGSDDEGASTEAQGRAIIDILGMDKRNEVLAALYMVRTDVSLSVRQAALHVWKTIVANTPKTLKEIMPILMSTLISSLASPSSERRQVAGRSLGELVRKLGERVLPLIIPILSKGLKDPDVDKRQGVCIGLNEVMASAGRSQLLSFMDQLIPTIRTALCDSALEVRESAGLAFSTLYKSAGLQAMDEIIPTLLEALEDDEMSTTALDGLKQIISVRTSAVLPHILPKLVHLPLSALNAHALGALAEVAGAGFNTHLGTILPALLSAMGDENKEVHSLAQEAAERVVLVIDEEGVETLLSELLKGVSDIQASIRRSSAYLIGYFFKSSKLYLIDEAPNMISTLIVMLSDSDSTTVAVSWEALARVVGSVPKEVLPSYIKLVRDAVSTARDKERRKRKGGYVVIPGLCLPKSLKPLLPVFLQGLISGSAELREQAALGLGELIEVTSEQALKEFVIPITGPLIRIIGDRFPWQVKSAILATLIILIQRGGMALKPFLPQLQTTFVKCLQDSSRTIRSSAALALGKLSALSTRIDPLVGDLMTSFQAADSGVREAILFAMRGVIKHAGKSIGPAVRLLIFDLLKDLLHHDDDQVRISATSMLGVLSQYLEAAQLSVLLQEVRDLSASQNWCATHGSVLCISSLLKHNPSTIMTSSLFSSMLNSLKSSLKDEKFPLRESSTKALGRLLLHQLAIDPSNTKVVIDVLSSIVSALHDDSSEVRRRALSSLKAFAKDNPSATIANVSVIGPPLAECLKDGNTPVRLAAERCALHVFQLTKGAENVQAAQKYITGLDARRLSKFPEQSDDSESDDDNAIG